MNSDNLLNEHNLLINRRHFFGRSAQGIGVAALASLLGREEASAAPGPLNGVLKKYHTPPKAKRMIYMFQSGAPSQQDLFDYKPTF